MKSQRYNWNLFWSEKAQENFIKSTGRSDENIFEIFFYVYSLCKILKLNKNDIILDAGGGNGMVAFLLSRFVKKIYTFDNSKSLIMKSRLLNKYNKNTIVYVDDIVNLNKTIRYKQIFTKVIIGSVYQYLKNYNEIKKSLGLMYKICSNDSILFSSLNPDLDKKKLHLKTYENDKLIKKIGIKRLKKSLFFETKRFWITKSKFSKIASSQGWQNARVFKINKMFFQSSHMFDIRLEKIIKNEN
jgi:SAM-dependent methyltransferase